MEATLEAGCMNKDKRDPYYIYRQLGIGSIISFTGFVYLFVISFYLVSFGLGLSKSDLF